MVCHFFRKGRKKHFAIAFPRVPLWQLYFSVSKYPIATIYIAKIGTAYAVDDLRPSRRLNYSIQI